MKVINAYDPHLTAKINTILAPVFLYKHRFSVRLNFTNYIFPALDN